MNAYLISTADRPGLAARLFEARVNEATPPVPEHSAYLAKYGAWITEFLTSAEEMATIYSVPIWVRPTRGRAFGA